MFNDERDVLALGWLLDKLFTAVEKNKLTLVIFGQLFQLFVLFLYLLVCDLQSCFLETTLNIQRFNMKAENATELKMPPCFWLHILDIGVTILHFKIVAFSCAKLFAVEVQYKLICFSSMYSERTL